MRDLNWYGNYCIDNLNAIGIYPNEIDEWKVNTRAKTRWGQASKCCDTYKIEISVLLLDERCPELSLMETIYHELLHCVDGCMNHSAKWKDLAELVNDCCYVNITRCTSIEEKLGEEYAEDIKNSMPKKEEKLFRICCKDCGRKYTQWGYRSPKWYAHPNNFKCKCGGDLIRY